MGMRAQKSSGTSCESDGCCYFVKNGWWASKNQCFIRKKFMYDAEITYEFAEATSKFIFVSMLFGSRYGYFGAVNSFGDLKSAVEQFQDVMHDIGLENSMPDKKSRANEFVQQFKTLTFRQFFPLLKAQLV